MLFEVREGFLVRISDVIFHLDARRLNQTAVSDMEDETNSPLQLRPGLRPFPTRCCSSVILDPGEDAARCTASVLIAPQGDDQLLRKLFQTLRSRAHFEKRWLIEAQVAVVVVAATRDLML